MEPFFSINEKRRNKNENIEIYIQIIFHIFSGCVYDDAARFIQRHRLFGYVSGEWSIL
jgi:hypothetical protein